MARPTVSPAANALCAFSDDVTSLSSSWSRDPKNDASSGNNALNTTADAAATAPCGDACGGGPCASSAARTARYCASERYANARKAATALGFAVPVFAEMKSRVIADHRTLAVLSPIGAASSRSADWAARGGRGSETRSAHPLNTRTATPAENAMPRGNAAILLMVPLYGWA